MRIAVIQVGYGEGSQESVAARADRVAGLVQKHGADHDLVVLPEMWSAGAFSPGDWVERAQQLPTLGGAGEARPALPEALAPIAEATRAIGAVVHAGSIVEYRAEPGPDGRHLWNTSVVFGPDGHIIERYAKIHRFGFGWGEPKLMEAGPELVVTDLPAPADALTVGLSTCYDLRFPELYRAQLDLGAQLFVIPAAWPAARIEAWRVLQRARAMENQCFVVSCNTAGTHGGFEMGGHSALINPVGEVLAEAGTDEEVLSVQIDPEEVGEMRKNFPVLADRRL